MTPYEGNQPYIFISYSHKDTDTVLSVIDALEKKGFRVWFDAGVEAGTEWPEYIASHLRRSACVLAFISPHFVASLNCRRELTFAQDLNVPMLNVYLSEVELSDGLRMQLGLNQCLFRNKFNTQEAFEEAVCRAEMLKSCQATAEESQAAAFNRTVNALNRELIGEKPTDRTISPADAPFTVPRGGKAAEATEESTAPPSGRQKALTWLTSLIQLSYAYTGILAVDIITRLVESEILQFVLMIFPSALTTGISLLLFRTLGRPLSKKEKSDAMSGPAFCWLLGLLIAIVGGIFVIHTEMGVFLKILSSIGFNLMPGFISMYMVGVMDE